MRLRMVAMAAGVTLAMVAFQHAALGQAKNVADVYSDKCAVCHGTDGAGKTARGKKLKVKDVRETIKKMNAAQMADVVIKGKDPDMEGFGKELGPDMVTQIVAYYRDLAKK
jgi:mono/diheme cytochrome c family protein